MHSREAWKLEVFDLILNLILFFGKIINMMALLLPNWYMNALSFISLLRLIAVSLQNYGINLSPGRLYVLFGWSYRIRSLHGIISRGVVGSVLGFVHYALWQLTMYNTSSSIVRFGRMSLLSYRNSSIFILPYLQMISTCF